MVTGTVTGILMGDWKSGAMIGATIQLLYMGNVTVGGIASYDKCYASIIATAVCIGAHQSPEIAVTIAVTLGTLGLIANNIFMTVSVSFVHMADKYIEKGETKKIWIFNWLLPQLLTFVLYGIPAFVAVYFGSGYLESFMNSIPAFVTTALTTVGMVLPALGIAVMLKTVFNTEFRTVYRSWIFMCCLSADEHYRLCNIGNCLRGIICNIADWIELTESEG